MAGSFDYDPEGDNAPLSDQATPILVCRYDPGQPSGQRYTHLQNVWCGQYQEKEGSEPSGAQFSYILSDTDFDGSQEDGEDPDEPPGYPAQFEETWPIASAPNDYKVVSGDELVVLAVDPEGNYRVKWHGYAKVPQTDLGPSSQHVTFTGSGAAERLWDTVVKGRIIRNGQNPSTSGDTFDTDLPTRFNPDDHPNCTPDDTDESFTDDDGDLFQFPVFLEPHLLQLDDDSETYSPVATFFTLGKCVRYLLVLANRKQQYIQNPDFSVMDDLLQNRTPTNGNGMYDPSDSSTYTSEPIIVRDYDATNKPAMDVIDELLNYAGFRMRFVCEGQPAQGDEFTQQDVIVEEPYDYIEIYRFDAAGPTDPKECWLPVTRTALDPDECNVASFHAVNDFHSLANQFTIETRPNRYEVSVILAPGYTPNAADVAPASQRQYLKANLDSAPIGIRQMYRYYIADELGEGHWNGTKTDKTPFDFSPVFPDETDDFESADGLQALDIDQAFGMTDAEQPEPQEGGSDTQFNSTQSYVNRYRPGLKNLFAKDPAGKIRHAQLAMSRDYTSPYPGTWDGTGTWQVIDGGWQLLEDRLGINVTVENVNAWAIGQSMPPPPLFEDPNPGQLQEPSGTLQGITSQALGFKAIAGKVNRQDPFYLRLTCVIESDQCIEATAKKRVASPYPFVIERRIDAKDHFVKNIIDGSSVYFEDAGGQFGEPLIVKDDTLLAQTHAEQMRSAHEFPPLAASIDIPWFSEIYDVGDRLKIMTGRDASFQVNAGSEQDEAPAYPFVSAITHMFTDTRQSTVLQLSDRRMEPQHSDGRHASGYGK